jgi:hypothetical protein
MANTAFTHDPTITVPSSTVNNRVVTWNGTTGKVFDNVATVTINAGVVAGVTALTVDNLTIDGNTIISTDSNGSITLTPNGSGSVVLSKVDINDGAIDGTAIGASSASTAVVTSITAPTAVLTNSTNSNAITLNTGATAANYTITMPTAAPAVSKVLKTTSGSTTQLEWGDAGGALSSTSVAFSRTASNTTTNDQQTITITGTTFVPTAIMVVASEDGGSLDSGSFGFCDEANSEYTVGIQAGGTYIILRPGEVLRISDGTNAMYASATLTSTGCTLTWTKLGSGLDVTGAVMFMR